jgi:ATP-dependent DNA helicase RecG
MRTAAEITELLDELDHCIADELENQDLDFKQWPENSRNDAIELVVKMAVCMVNGGGGTVVFGVADHIKGRANAILGIPLDIDVNILKKAVYDKTDPKITPVFEDLKVPEGTGRVLIIQIYPGLPPYTDTSGRGTVRIGKDCQPLTGTMRKKIAVETGENDYTAEQISGDPGLYLSPSAMEQLRQIAQEHNAPEDLLRLSDIELLKNLDLMSASGHLTRAGLLLGGTEDAIRQFIPGHVWTFLQMETDTSYINREDKTSAIPVSIKRLEDLLVPFNPITTVVKGMYHFEYRTYPPLAIREVLINAFCHRDYQMAGPVLVKVFPTHLEISNNGGFIGGITSNNILHHSPSARNPCLVGALIRLHLVNRSNLGISRVFEAFLMEGKEPPCIDDVGDSVRVVFRKQEMSAHMRAFISEQAGKGRYYSVDELLIIHYLLHHPEIVTYQASVLCQRSEAQIRDTLFTLESEGLIERGGAGRGTYWSIPPGIHQLLSDSKDNNQKRRIDREAAKTRILSILMERARRGEKGLTNSDIRKIIHYDRNQVYQLMKELQREGAQVKWSGRGQSAMYEYIDNC